MLVAALGSSRRRTVKNLEARARRVRRVLGFSAAGIPSATVVEEIGEAALKPDVPEGSRPFPLPLPFDSPLLDWSLPFTLPRFALEVAPFP